MNLNQCDYYGSAAIGLCKAVRGFDEERGLSFSTFAYICMRNECLQQLRTERKFYPPKGMFLVSLQSETNIDNDGKHETYLEDIIGDDFINIESESILNAQIAEYFENAKDRDKSIVLQYIKGYDQTEIGNMFGLSQSYISRILKKFKRCLVG